VTSPATRYELDRATVEHAWACHVAASAGEPWLRDHVTHRTIRRFLDGLRIPGTAAGQRLLLDEAAIRHWMINTARGAAVTYAAHQLASLDRFLKVLTRSGLLDTDLLAGYRTGPKKPSWLCLVRALQAEDPETALATLRRRTVSAGPLAAYTASYLQLRRSLARECESHRSALSDLDRFLLAQGVSSIQAVTPALIASWVQAMACGVRRRLHKTRCVRRFFDHLRSLALVTDNPVPLFLTERRRLPASRFRPFLFTKEQIAALLAAARQLPDSRKFRYRGPTCFTMLALLSTLGLRHGEVRRLRLRDVNLDQQTLLITQTKFHKSRYVPFGPKVAACLQHYLEARPQRLVPWGEGDPLFVTFRRQPMARQVLLTVFRSLLGTLGITGLPGQPPPRLHDLRHTFAVQCLLRWYRQGIDVQSRLPVLATFMGHVEPRSTEIYLTITADLLHEANARFHKHFGPSSAQETSP
jgi:site-specific recombinase XerD